VADLSPAAQAVLDALLNAPVNSGQVRNGKAPQIKLAAALRAAVDQVAKADPLGDTVEDCIRGAEREHMRGKFYTLAAELENHR
jgi:hypothetical protein